MVTWHRFVWNGYSVKHAMKINSKLFSNYFVNKFKCLVKLRELDDDHCGTHWDWLWGISWKAKRSLSNSIKKNGFQVWRLPFILFIIGCNQYDFLSDNKAAIIISELVHQARL